MAVLILNHMPDANVHRGEPVRAFLHELNLAGSAKSLRPNLSGRALFLAATIALHVVALIAFMQLKMHERVKADPAPIVASLIEAPAQQQQDPPEFSPPPLNVAYSLPTPQDISIETETITLPEPATSVVAPHVSSVAPPMIDTVEYVRTSAPVYPRESQRRREHGTVVLRVLVDSLGRPAQIQVERSSGFDRLDAAAREAVQKFLFRPYEVGGIAKPAQVLIPIGFEPRSS